MKNSIIDPLVAALMGAMGARGLEVDTDFDIQDGVIVFDTKDQATEIAWTTAEFATGVIIRMHENAFDIRHGDSFVRLTWDALTNAGITTDHTPKTCRHPRMKVMKDLRHKHPEWSEQRQYRSFIPKTKVRYTKVDTRIEATVEYEGFRKFTVEIGDTADVRIGREYIY